MTRLAPVSREELVRKLRKLGFDGPYLGGRHQFMVQATVRLVLPNPHRSEIGMDLFARILREAGIAREEWLK